MFRVHPSRINGMKGAISSFSFEREAHCPHSVRIVRHGLDGHICERRLLECQSGAQAACRHER
jgi:hypothetical protein